MAKSQVDINFIVVVLRGLIRVYQWQAPFWGPRCRFYPSCSEYMRETLLAEGFWKGLWQGLLRLSKCHPWHPGGFDPVRTTHGK